jgi:cephalosporin-C deacetylase
LATRDNYAGDSSVEVYEFNEHEGGQSQHWRKRAKWLREMLDTVKSPI